MSIEWDKTRPTGSQPMSDVDDAIRDTRAGVEMMLDDEHDVDVSDPANPRATHKDNFITNAMLQDNVVTTAEIDDGTIAVADLAATTITYLLPAGAVMAFARNTVPNGWLECNGAAVSRTTYADLFAAIGTTFGAGDGSTTFNLPDLRGEFIRGWDHGRGVDSGRTLGSWQADEFAGHFHVSGYSSGGVTPRYGTTTGLASARNDYDAGGTDGTSGTNTSTVGGTETRGRNVALMYCIKT